MGQMDATQPVKAKLRVPMIPAEDASVGLLLKWSVSSAAEISILICCEIDKWLFSKILQLPNNYRPVKQ